MSDLREAATIAAVSVVGSTTAGALLALLVIVTS